MPGSFDVGAVLLLSEVAENYKVFRQNEKNTKFSCTNIHDTNAVLSPKCKILTVNDLIWSEAHNLCNLPGHLFTFSPARDELVDQSSPTNLPSVSSCGQVLSLFFLIAHYLLKSFQIRLSKQKAWSLKVQGANSDIKNPKQKIPMWPVSGPELGNQNCWPTDLIKKNTKSDAHENFHASHSI